MTLIGDTKVTMSHKIAARLDIKNDEALKIIFPS